MTNSEQRNNISHKSMKVRGYCCFQWKSSRRFVLHQSMSSVNNFSPLSPVQESSHFFLHLLSPKTAGQAGNCDVLIAQYQTTWTLKRVKAVVRDCIITSWFIVGVALPVTVAAPKSDWWQIWIHKNSTLFLNPRSCKMNSGKSRRLYLNPSNWDPKDLGHSTPFPKSLILWTDCVINFNCGCI